MKLTTQLYLVPRPRMHGIIPLLPHYAFMALCSVTAQGQVYLYVELNYFVQVCQAQQYMLVYCSLQPSKILEYLRN